MWLLGLRPLSPQRTRHLRERAAEGPWIEPWVNRPGHPYNRLLNDLGVDTTAYAPVRDDDRLVGVLVINAVSLDRNPTIEALPALAEFADLAGALIGRGVAERSQVKLGRDRIAALIASEAFHPVFQPIVDLVTRTIVGYEALTRFDDGAAPDARFAEALAVGLGAEMEMATCGPPSPRRRPCPNRHG